MSKRTGATLEATETLSVVERIVQLRQTPSFLFWRLHKRAMSTFTEELAASGADITPVQYAALTMIDSMPGMDQATLSSHLAYDRATLGKVIDRLEQRALMARRKHPTDRRAHALYILPGGVEILGLADSCLDRTRRRLLDSLPIESQEIFFTLLKELLDPLPEI